MEQGYITKDKCHRHRDDSDMYTSTFQAIAMNTWLEIHICGSNIVKMSIFVYRKWARGLCTVTAQLLYRMFSAKAQLISFSRCFSWGMEVFMANDYAKVGNSMKSHRQAPFPEITKICFRLFQPTRLM